MITRRCRATLSAKLSRDKVTERALIAIQFWVYLPKQKTANKSQTTKQMQRRKRKLQNSEKPFELQIKMRLFQNRKSQKSKRYFSSFNLKNRQQITVSNHRFQIFENSNLKFDHTKIPNLKSSQKNQIHILQTLSHQNIHRKQERLTACNAGRRRREKAARRRTPRNWKQEKEKDEKKKKRERERECVCFFFQRK